MAVDRAHTFSLLACVMLWGNHGVAEVIQQTAVCWWAQVTLPDTWYDDLSQPRALLLFIGTTGQHFRCAVVGLIMFLWWTDFKVKGLVLLQFRPRIRPRSRFSLIFLLTEPSIPAKTGEQPPTVTTYAHVYITICSYILILCLIICCRVCLICCINVIV